MIGYLEESWSLGKTYCHSDSSEKPPVKTGMGKHV